MSEDFYASDKKATEMKGLSFTSRQLTWLQRKMKGLSWMIFMKTPH
ncbi:MAG: hypothetical protein CM15mV86_400 [uncultured marine virus]|nr:MAG: hypothetical protein CM15mV86_400 [uncultured marine virus]